MKLVVTVFEKTLEAARQAVKGLTRDHDMVEIRVDAFGGGDLEVFRNLTDKPLLFTNRGGEPVDVDFGLIDVEFARSIKHPERTVLSFHDFNGVPDLEPLIASMLAEKCAYTKIAVTPSSFADNERILSALRPGLTFFGMGERGLYSRILAPFFGSQLAFVSVDEKRAAAPGQISLDRALAIYGEPAGRRRSGRRDAGAPKVFTLIGNPVAHSLSPTIHNPLFRERGVDAAYAVACLESFEEVVDAFTAGRIAGMSVTAPFKDDAFAFAQRMGARIGVNATEARAVNTLVNTKSGVIADNTDVDGFEFLLREHKGKTAAVLGAGGTGRAAVVAARRAGFDVTVYNRTPRDGALPLTGDIRADVVINTLPVPVNITTTIDAAYSGTQGSGYKLLQAQAIRQNVLFLKAFE